MCVVAAVCGVVVVMWVSALVGDGGGVEVTVVMRVAWAEALFWCCGGGGGGLAELWRRGRRRWWWWCRQDKNSGMSFKDFPSLSLLFVNPRVVY